MKTNHKFKVGDKVRFISKDSFNAKYFKCPIDNLKIKQLIDENNYYIYDSVVDCDLFVTGEELELIPETYKYEVVHTETQEQWDFVYKKTNSKQGNNWYNYKNYTGFCLNMDEYTGIRWYRVQNSKIYTFEEWLDKFGHLSEYLKQNQKEKQWIPQVGDYVITEGYSNSYDGRILKITKIDSNRYYYFEVFDKGYYDKTHNFSKKAILRKALPHEIPTQELSKEDLLAEAKRRFPIGCKFKCLDLFKQNTQGGKIHSIDFDSFKYYGETCHYKKAITDGDNGFIYIDGIWAETVEEPKVKGDKTVFDIEGYPQSDWSQVLVPTGKIIFEAPYQKPVKNNKILPIKVRNSNITESTELPKRTRIKIIKKQLLTI